MLLQLPDGQTVLLSAITGWKVSGSTFTVTDSGGTSRDYAAGSAANAAAVAAQVRGLVLNPPAVPQTNIVTLTSFNAGSSIASSGGTNVNVVGTGFTNTGEIWITGTAETFDKGVKCPVVSVSDTLMVVTLPNSTGVDNVGDVGNVRDASGDDYFDVIYRDSASGDQVRLTNAAQWGA